MKRTVLTEVSAPRIIRVHQEPSSVDWCFYFICVLIVLLICLGVPLIVMQVRFCGRRYRYITYVSDYVSGANSSVSGIHCFAPKIEDQAHDAEELDLNRLDKRQPREIVEQKSKIIWTKNKTGENKIKMKKYISASSRFKQYVASFNDLKLATCSCFEEKAANSKERV